MRILIFWERSAPEGLGLPLGRRLSRILGMACEVSENPIHCNGFVGSRRQYDARALLDCIALARRRHGIFDPFIMVTGHDIFYGHEEFVYGLSRPGEMVAVVSTFRLSNAFYNRPDDPDMLLERLVKETAHEVGHLRGLLHCPDTHCVMYSPRGLDELDRKRQNFCPACTHSPDTGTD